MNFMVILQGQAKLLQVAFALGSPRGFACLLHRRQEKRNENRNNCDDDQEFNESKTPMDLRSKLSHKTPFDLAMQR